MAGGQVFQDILKTVKTIAMVGASPDRTKFSYGVLRVLNETGYDMIPVNPRPEIKEIRGLKVYPTLASIDRSVDMVEVFRRSEELIKIAREAVEISAKVLWGQHAGLSITRRFRFPQELPIGARRLRVMNQHDG